MAKLEITPDQIKETKKRGELNGIAVVRHGDEGRFINHRDCAERPSHDTRFWANLYDS